MLWSYWMNSGHHSLHLGCHTNIPHVCREVSAKEDMVNKILKERDGEKVLLVYFEGEYSSG